jgi:hypothetical protein
LRDEPTLSQLALIRYKPNARGQIVIEAKEELLRRGVKSPDRADSVMLAFAVRQDPVDALIDCFLPDFLAWRLCHSDSLQDGPYRNYGWCFI